MAGYIGKINAGGTTRPVASTLYGTCDTAASTAAKVVTCTNFDTLITGVTIKVKFTNGNTVASPTLNVNSTGAKTISGVAKGSNVYNNWDAGNVVSFTYDGTNWVLNDHIGIMNPAVNAMNYKGVKNAWIEGEGTSYTPGNYSHSEGKASAQGDYSHAEGSSIANGYYSHAEGNGKSSGQYSHVEGSSHSEGNYSHAEGKNNFASQEAAHAEGVNNSANAYASHVEGQNNIIFGSGSDTDGAHHIEGTNNKTEISIVNHIEGSGNYIGGGANASHIGGMYNMINNHNYSFMHGLSLLDSPSQSNIIPQTILGKYNKPHPGYNIQRLVKNVVSGIIYEGFYIGDDDIEDVAVYTPNGQKAGTNTTTIKSGTLVYLYCFKSGTISGVVDNNVSTFTSLDTDYLGALYKTELGYDGVLQIGGGTSNTNRKNIATITSSGDATFAGNISCNQVNGVDVAKALTINSSRSSTKTGYSYDNSLATDWGSSTSPTVSYVKFDNGLAIVWAKRYYANGPSAWYQTNNIYYSDACPGLTLPFKMYGYSCNTSVQFGDGNAWLTEVVGTEDETKTANFYMMAAKDYSSTKGFYTSWTVIGWWK